MHIFIIAQIRKVLYFGNGALGKTIKYTIIIAMWYKPGGKIFNKEYLSNFNKNVPKESTLQEVDFIEKFLKPKTKILDLACGWGRHAIELGARGYEVTALDLNPFYLNVGKKESKRRGISINWVKGDMRRLPFKSYIIFQKSTNII